MDSFPDAALVFSEAEVGQAYRTLAAGLQPLVTAGDCVLIGVLMGGMIPAAQLAGMLSGDFLLDCCQVSRYRGGVNGGEPEWVLAPKASLEGKTVLLVDDIYDEGVTLDYVVSALLQRGAAQVISAVLVRKRHDRAKGRIRPDFVGLEVDDRYVFGCGMDYQHRWRHLPAIYALTDE
jgi:hypoxanthine phosphoribosyltransferase